VNTTFTRPGGFGFIQDTQTLVVAILIGCVCFLLTVLIAVMAPYLFPVPLPRITTATAERGDSVDAAAERVKRRYQTIANWLITKEVVAHSADHRRCRVAAAAAASEEHLDGDDNIDGSKNAPENHHDVIEKNSTSSCCDAKQDCHICMDTFQVGDKVSWSAAGHCRHAYHFRCIKEWLLKKKDCPDCRQTVLPVDDDFTDIVPLVEAKKRLEALTFFCQQDGLIVMPSTTIMSPSTRSDNVLLAARQPGRVDHEVGGAIEDENAYDFEPPLDSSAIVEAAIFDGTNDDVDLEAAAI